MPEIEIMVTDDDFMSPWGPIGGPPRYRGELTGMDPIFAITPDVVGACLRPGGFNVSGILSIADPGGYLTLITPVGSWKYELFPACFDDGEGPALYLAVWPD